MAAFLSAYWPALVGGLIFGIVAGFLAFRPRKR